MARVLDRAAAWLLECEYIQEIWYRTENGAPIVYFRKKVMPRSRKKLVASEVIADSTEDPFKQWLAVQDEADLMCREADALSTGYGSEFERRIVDEERSNGVPILRSRRIRQEYIRRFIDSNTRSLAV
jgi:hypothetical protein